MAFGDFTVVRSTVKRVLNSSGVLAEVAINTPAFEFNADGSYKGLLVEPAGTNLILRSAELDDGQWSKNELNTTGTPAWVNVAVAPDGTTTAEKLIENTTTNTHFIATSLATTVIASTYTGSVFLKADERSNVRLSRNGGAVASSFNLSTQAILDASGSVGKIEDYGNGWYRCSVTFSAASTSTSLYIELQTSASVSQESYLGDGTSGLFAWGGQFELGAVATSYMPTVASTANRTADSVTLTGASSLIGQSEGTIFLEAEVGSLLGATGRCMIDIFGTNAENRMFVGFTGLSSNTIRAFLTETNVTDVDKRFSVGSALSYKVAFAYKTTDSELYINGGAGTSTTDNAFSFPVSISQIHIGRDLANATHFNGWIRSVALFPTRLSNAQLESLTTL